MPQSSLVLLVQRPGAAPEVRRFAGPRVTCGRRGRNTLVLDEPEVSQHHAVFEYRTERWVLLDCGSTNGTFVDEVRLGSGEEREVAAGSLVRLGPCLLRVEDPARAIAVMDTRADVAAALGSRGATSWRRLSERVQELLRARFPRNAAPPPLDFDDFVSEVLLAVVRDLGEFEPRGPGTFLAWVQTVAQNRLVDLWRHHNAQRRREPGPRDVRDPDSLPHPGGPTDTQQLRLRELEAIEMECLRALPGHAQEVYLRRRRDELDFARIAAETGGLSEIAARSLFKRAREQVRQCIARKADALGASVRSAW